MRPFRSIAIDGPSGAGKSTLAKALAARLGFLYVDTGAIYRTVGLYVARQGGDCGDPQQVLPRLPELQLSLTYGADGLLPGFRLPCGPCLPAGDAAQPGQNP